MQEDVDNFSMVVRKGFSLLPRLNQLLVEPPQKRLISNQDAKDVEAFGYHRLGILQCFECLLNLGNPIILSQLLRTQWEMHKTIFDLLLKFPSNNFCHLFVERILCVSVMQASPDDIVEFLQHSEFPTKLVQGWAIAREQKLLVTPFLVKITYCIAERQKKSEEVEKYLLSVPGWEELTSSLSEEFSHLDHQQHGGFDPSEDSQQEHISSENSAESSNDADDYDTLQAEVLLGRDELDVWLVEVF